MPTTYSKESLADALIAIRNRGWIALERNSANDGAIGNTLEDLLGIVENNLPIPNAAEWELKTQRRDTASLVTLFHLDPSPRALKLVSYLTNKYGWPHDEAGTKYDINEKSFRQTLTYQQRTIRGFCLDVDDASRKIVVNFSAIGIADSLQAWKDSLVERGSVPFDVTYTPYWGFDDVFHAAGVKLHNCFFVVADTKKENNTTYVKYPDIYILSNFSIENFIGEIKAGHILVDFDARTHHNHGTKFRIHSRFLPQLYRDVTIIAQGD